jgi:carboxylate-amine ligase
VLHVIELKTNGPASQLTSLSAMFQEHVQKINGILQQHQAKLLPTGMHPFMNPFKETRLWPHEYNAVYEAYNRIFDCRGHGWSNLQSTHLNLPFANDEEFGRLHAAIRLLLPIIPALSASSPLIDGKLSGFADTRLEVYRTNQAKIPAIAGLVIPEPVFTEADYDEKILQHIYQQIAPYDSNQLLQDEFLNSRGAIARFSRGAIEIRLIDIQECPIADISLLATFVEILKMLVSEKWSKLEVQQAWATEPLAAILLSVIRDGQEALISNPAYLKCFGWQKAGSCTAGELWQFLAKELITSETLNPEFSGVLHHIITKGNLATRIRKALPQNYTLDSIQKVYHALAACLEQGKLFN